MSADAREGTAWAELRDALPRAHRRAEALIQRVDVDGSDDLLDLTLAELGTALEELSVALVELDQQHLLVLELQHTLDTAGRRGREVFDALPYAFVVTDRRGLVLEANAAAMGLLRQTTDFLHGKPMAAFVAEGRRTDFYGLLESVSGGTGRASGQLPFRPDPDRSHSVEVAHGSLSGEPVLFWSIPDITPVQVPLDTPPPSVNRSRPASIAEELESAKALAAQLQHALDSRIVIEQAKGRLAERLGITEVDAFAILRRHARGTGIKLVDAAQAVASGDLQLS